MICSIGLPIGSSPDSIPNIARACTGLALIESCVSFGDEFYINPVDEPTENPTQSISGVGCRPTRRWVFDSLKRFFPHVYQPSFQPDHALDYAMKINRLMQQPEVTRDLTPNE